MSKKYKTIHEFLATCTEDEKDFIYDIYVDMSVDELIDIIFHNLSPEDVIEEIENYREEVAEEIENGEEK